jgi:hypothetical protein
MATHRNPLMTATRLILEAQQPEADEEEPTLDLLGLPAVERSANLSRAGRGRPPGARNRTTRDWLDYLSRRYGSPLEILAQMARAPVDELARELGCTRLDAYVQKRHAAESLAPYLHPKLSSVEVHPPGHPAGPPSLLTLVSQDWAEVTDAVVEGVVEASDAGESEPESTAPAVSAARADGDNVETQVADEIVEQALDAVLLLARDPRYTEAIRRRLKALK